MKTRRQYKMIAASLFISITLLIYITSACKCIVARLCDNNGELVVMKREERERERQWP